MVALRLLGPIEIWTPAGAAGPGRPQQAAVLAVLAADANRPVSTEVIVERVWGETPARNARRIVHTHIARIRRLLAAAGAEQSLLRSPAGYLLQIEPDRVDLYHFRGLVRQARQLGAGDPVRQPDAVDRPRAALLRDALRLWRGEPLAGMSGEWAQRKRTAWRQEYLDAAIAWAQAEEQAGEVSAVLDQLTELTGEYPFVEPLAAVLIRALWTSGRPAEALARYAVVRRGLVDQLGTEPGPQLRALHQAILRDENQPGGRPPEQPREHPVSQPPVASAPSPATTPAQLPLEPFGFVGRERQIDQLDAILGDDSGQSAPAPIVVLSGASGVGKTALALHWAHRVAARFPDGQLYVNLRGFDPDATVDPADALQGFLIGLGVAAPRIPLGVASRAALFRSLVAGRRMLVLLDNASAADQVRPLLPGAASCSVLVTSRNQLASLAAVEGAVPATLDVLTPAEARQMLARRLGSARTEAERSAVDEIIERCARLPLALAIAIARAAARPDFMLGVLAQELRDGWRTFDVLDAGDPTADVRTVFSWSYRLLSSEAARLYRLLGLHPGPDVSAPAAASLAGIAEERARGLLTDLTRANLLVERAPARWYAAHDLLRAWAGDLCQRTDPQAEREAAVHRLLDHYLHTARTAALLLQPRRRPIALAAATTGAVPEELTDLDQALAWFKAEHAVLLMVVRRAADSGFDAHTWQLVWALGYYFHRLGHWHDWVSVSRIALAATQRLADPSAQAYARRGLARALTLLDDHEEARRHLLHALALADAAGDRTGQAYTHHHLAEVCHRQGRDQEALDHTRQALDLHRAAGDKVGLGTALNNLGWYHTRLGDYDEAVNFCRQALAVHRETADRDAEAATWDSMGHAYQELGHYRRAIACYRWAARLARKLGRRYSEATTLGRLGETYHAAGWSEAACESWRRALEILDDIAHPEADQLRARLESVCQPTVAARQPDPGHPD